MKGEQNSQGTKKSILRWFCVSTHSAKAAKDRLRHPVQQPPNYKGPVRAVPQPAEHHRDDQIQIRQPLRPRSRQREEQVIAQPVGKADMPFPPELADVLSGIRLVEVLR